MGGYDVCDDCGSLDHLDRAGLCLECRTAATPDEPSDDEVYNRVGVEGGIGYSLEYDGPGSLGENDWRL